VNPRARRDSGVLLLASAAYIIIYYFIYTCYLHPVFDYARYNLIDRPWPFLALTGVLALVPVLACGGLTRISSFMAYLIYLLCYVPTILTLGLALPGGMEQVLDLQCAFLAGMVLLFCMDRFPEGNAAAGRIRRLPLAHLTLLTALATLYVIQAYGFNLRFVALDEVYALRSENLEKVGGTLVGYLVMWLTSCLYPLHLAIGLMRRSLWRVLAACAGLVLIYMATGAKASLFTPVIVFLLFGFLKLPRPALLPALALGLSAVSIALLLLPEDPLVLKWSRSLFFMRTLSVNGWSNKLYFEFFSTHGFTWYSHLSWARWLTAPYPYGPFQPGQVLGLEVSGSELANFNANFWSTEGIAAAGGLGVLVASGLMAVFLWFSNRVTEGLDLTFTILVFAQFAITLLNIPFFTAMWSGAGLPLLAMLTLFEFGGEEGP